jgi:hypothetical protein
MTEPTLGEFMEDWFGHDALPNLAPNTIAAYLPAYRNHIRSLPVEFGGAARPRAGRGARVPRPWAPATETLRCEPGAHDWARPKTPGRQPRSCPEHRGGRGGEQVARGG